MHAQASYLSRDTLEYNARSTVYSLNVVHTKVNFNLLPGLERRKTYYGTRDSSGTLLMNPVETYQDMGNLHT